VPALKFFEMADGASLKFPNITHVGKAGVGLFKATSDQFGFKRTEPGLPDHLVQFAGKEVASAEWQNACGRKYLLKFSLKQDGADHPPVMKFTGFDKKDFEKLKAHLTKHFSIELAEVVVATQGWSWGDIVENDTELRIMAGDKLGFEVPISNLGQVTAQKGDLSIELQDMTDGPSDEVLHEIRLQVVPERLSAETLQQELQQKAGLSERGEAIARISDVMLVAPRGKHDIEFFKTIIKVHGKSQTYTVQYKHIARLFLMTLPGEKDIALVVGLDQPLRSGTQVNNFLIFIIQKASEMIPNLPDERLKEYSMAAGSNTAVYGLLARLLKDLSGKPVTAPASDLKTRNKVHCLKCSHKAQPGFLFPMKKSLIFITKPVVWLRYDEIDSIEFIKGLSRARSFDIIVHVSGNPEVEFLQMEAEDRDELIRFFQTVNVRLINAETTKTRENRSQLSIEDPAPSRPRGEAASSARETPEAGKEGGGGDDDDEDDEDFDDEAESSSEGSEPAPDDDDVESEDDDEAPKKKKQRK